MKVRELVRVGFIGISGRFSRGYALAAFLCSLILLGVVFSSTWTSTASPTSNAVYSETSPSWNPGVSCFANVTTIENVVDLAGTTSFNSTTGGALYLAGGFLLAGTISSNPQNWPFDKRSLSPPCNVSVNGQVIPTFVEIHNVDLVFATDQRDCSQAKIGFCDTTLNLQDPSCPGFKTGHSPLCEIYVEIDQAWKFAGIAPPPVTNNTSVRIDIQGFVYWDPTALSSKSHNFSGWELHSLSAWRFSSKSTPNDFYLASYPGMLHVPAGRSSSATVTIGSLSATTKGTVFLNGVPDVTTGLTASFNPSQVSLVALGSQGSTRIVNMTVQASSSLSPGLHQILVVNGTDSTHFVAVAVQVAEFFISPLPPVLFPYNPGGSATVTVNSLNQFSGNVNVSVVPFVFSNQNLTITPHWALLSIASGSSLSQLFQFTSATPQAYEVNVTALCAGCSVAQSDSFLLDVNATDFHLTTTPTVPLIVKIGSSSKETIRVASILDFTGNVALTDKVVGSGNGISLTLNSSSLLVPHGGTVDASLNVSVSFIAAPGIYSVQVNGTFGSLVHTTSFVVGIGVPIIATVEGTDNLLYWNSLSTGTWSGWQSLSGKSPSPQAVCKSSVQSLEVVVRGADNGIYHKTLFANGTSTAWDSPGGSTIDEPACAVLNGALYVVVRGSDNARYLNSFLLKSRAWSSWEWVGGSGPSAPILVATPPNRLDLIVRASNNAIYHMQMAVGSWPTVFLFPWESPGGATNDVVSAVSDGTVLHTVVRGTDNLIYYNNLTLSTGTWSSWTPLAGATSSAPAMAIDASGTIHLVVRGLDNIIYHKSKAKGQGWSAAWDSPGGATLASPAALTFGPDLEVVVTGTDDFIYYNSLVASGWLGWVPMGGGSFIAPSLGQIS